MPKKAHFGAFLRVFSRCLCGVVYFLNDPCFSRCLPKLKKCFLCGRSHTSATLIVHRSVARLVTPPYPSLVVLTAMSVGDLTMVPLSPWWPMVAD
jgi:hypothetical protein